MIWWIILVGLLALSLMLIIASLFSTTKHSSSSSTQPSTTTQLSSTSQPSTTGQPSSTTSSTQPPSTEKICVFDFDGTLVTCHPDWEVCPALEACQDAGWKIAIATASDRAPSECCTGDPWMTTNICPNGTCIIDPEDWYYAGTGGLVHGNDIPVNDDMGEQPDSSQKQWALAQLAEKYGSSKDCTLLFDDSGGVRESVNEAGYPTLCAWDPTCPYTTGTTEEGINAITQQFKDGAESCEFIS